MRFVHAAAPHVKSTMSIFDVPLLRNAPAMLLPAPVRLLDKDGALNPKAEYAYAREQGITVHHISDVERKGAASIAEDAVARRREFRPGSAIHGGGLRSRHGGRRSTRAISDHLARIFRRPRRADHRRPRLQRS